MLHHDVKSFHWHQVTNVPKAYTITKHSGTLLILFSQEIEYFAKSNCFIIYFLSRVNVSACEISWHVKHVSHHFHQGKDEQLVQRIEVKTWKSFYLLQGFLLQNHCHLQALLTMFDTFTYTEWSEILFKLISDRTTCEARCLKAFTFRYVRLARKGLKQATGEKTACYKHESPPVAVSVPS